MRSLVLVPMLLLSPTSPAQNDLYDLDTVRDFERWADGSRHGKDELPRAVGMHGSSLRGARFERYTSPYTLWMLQRPQDAYTALGKSERDAVDAALAGTGLEAMLAYRPRHRLGKRQFKLVFEG